MTAPVIELRGLARTYPASPPVLALRPTDLVISEGDYVAVTGASGSGKSTLLHLLGLLDTPTVSGIFNVGTGEARSFRDLITAMFAALGREPAIEYIDMPLSIRDSYQYFTQAETENLRRAGYNAHFTTLEEAVRRYVTSYLDRADRYR